MSDVDLTPLGWVKPATAAIPALTDPLIEKTPFIGGGVGLLLWGVGAIIQRRMRLMGGGDKADGASAKKGNGDA